MNKNHSGCAKGFFLRGASPSAGARFRRVIFKSLILVGTLCFHASLIEVLVGQDRPLNPEAVRKSIKHGSEFILSKQLADGSWPQFQYLGDTTALCTLALLNTDDEANQTAIDRGIRYLLTLSREDRMRNYVLALRIMVLATADPKGEKYRRELSADVKFLLENQVTEGAGKGGWTYERTASMYAHPDSSNSQFALLALHEASVVGVKIPRKNWELAREYWKTCLDPRSGGFSYRPGDQRVLGSMTCAGISSWIIIEENLADPGLLFDGDRALCCRPNPGGDVVEQAIQWLVRNYSVKANPVGFGQGNNNVLYYLYGMERAGRMAGRRYFGPHDWYRDGAKELLFRQQRDGHWSSRGHGEDMPQVGTALALLFLSKGKRPVAIGKYQYAENQNWDLHPDGVHFLTRRLETDWAQKLNWQTVSGVDGTVDDLLEAPVLFMSGTKPLQLNARQKENLKKYLENGGFLFAEGCQGEGCDEGGFDKAFRDLMIELFPDSELEVLETAHPIWNAQYPLLPNSERPLLGLRACCRTSVIYCPANLSCYWALERPAVKEIANAELKRRIEYCSQLGVNVITYATGRMLKDKGEAPKLMENTIAILNHRALEFPKLLHAGGADEAPNALRILMKEMQTIGLRMNLDKKLISPKDDQLYDFPFVFIHGRSGFRFTDEERASLKTYLENGGFLFADSICSSREFTQSFRQEIQLVTGQNLRPLPPEHDIWEERYGGTIPQVTLRTRNANAPGGFDSSVRRPELEGVEIGGRVAVVFSPHDISCALENTSFSQCDGYTHEDALRIGKKVVFYSLLSDRLK
jgi:hypothetical protein